MFAENPADFLGDFGVPVVYGGVTKTVIFDMPGQDILSGRISNNQYEMTYVEADMPGLLFGATITYNGHTYQLINTNLIDDGIFSRAILEEIS